MLWHNISMLVYHLESYFSKKKNHDGFSKSHNLSEIQLKKQVQETSWFDDLGYKRTSFNHAFDVIGIRYVSQTAYLSQIDQFYGKLYASYYNRKMNRLIYIRNHVFANRFFEDIPKPATPKP